ncbi:hypothetical protein M514_01586 [Trichuris suis]|uniref:Uncharacterized protein n=1 Tax=Trichuris suis TaxID=68888 RepID=A0A085NAT9_9BILA|nr:hypothetical protein M513_01586 [Trichuris suis]KFD66585.1 hypothetical protein M514_01586 [Trichuris suis]
MGTSSVAKDETKSNLRNSRRRTARQPYERTPAVSRLTFTLQLIKNVVPRCGQGNTKCCRPQLLEKDQIFKLATPHARLAWLPISAIPVAQANQ